ncbi:MAG: hypothetical protein N4A61_14805 [Pelagimonas sp.]|nr:hypothetical protein [Pelagimonas sp.]
MLKPLTTGLVASVLALGLAASPAAAGNGTFKSADGTKLRISCKSSGCTVSQKPKGGKWAKISKSEGGRANYLKLVEKYKAEGYK